MNACKDDHKVQQLRQFVLTEGTQVLDGLTKGVSV